MPRRFCLKFSNCGKLRASRSGRLSWVTLRANCQLLIAGVGIRRLGQVETEALLGSKSDFLLAGGMGGGGSASGAKRRSTACSTSNESEVAVLVAATADKDAVGLERHGFPVQCDRREGDAHVAGIVHASRLTHGQHFSGEQCALRSNRLVIDQQRLTQHCEEPLAGKLNARRLPLKSSSVSRT